MQINKKLKHTASKKLEKLQDDMKQNVNHGNPHVHYTTYNSQYRDGFTIRWD